jgi:uncharacterized protein YjbI with pentapeptide repeats
MANDAHVALLRQGTIVWNEWCRGNPGITADLREADLSRADLSEATLVGTNLSLANLSRANLNRTILREAVLHHAFLSGAHLREANLIRADLTSTNLIRADLSGAGMSAAALRWANLAEAELNGADLSAADLREADLSQVNLAGAGLREADLSGANVRGTKFNHALLYETILGNLDLTETNGLNECRHSGPSTIDFRTLSKSANLPISFLRGCGLPDNLIDYLPSLCRGAIQFYSCFISYSAKDKVFAERLHADLQDKGVRCWFAPHDLSIGAKTWDAIDEAIRLRDKLLVVLSKASLGSDWVEDEVSKAYAEERSRKEVVLFPIRIDNAMMSTAEPWAVKLRDQRNIGDFRQWKKPAGYHKSLERLLRDLTTSGTK